MCCLQINDAHTRSHVQELVLQEGNHMYHVEISIMDVAFCQNHAVVYLFFVAPKPCYGSMWEHIAHKITHSSKIRNMLFP